MAVNERSARHKVLPPFLQVGFDHHANESLVPLCYLCANGIRAEMAYQKLKGLGYKVRFLNEEITVAADGSYKI